MKPYFIVVFCLFLFSGAKAQIENIEGKVVIKYMTSDDMGNPQKIDIKRAAYYDQTSGKFYHNENGVDFVGVKSVEDIAFINPVGDPIKARVIEEEFEITYKDHFSENPPTTGRIEFRGWDNATYSVSPDALLNKPKPTPNNNYWKKSEILELVATILGAIVTISLAYIGYLRVKDAR